MHAIRLGLTLGPPQDREEVIARAQAANVACMVVTGTCVATSQAAQRLCARPDVSLPLYFTAGVHPHDAKTCNDK